MEFLALGSEPESFPVYTSQDQLMPKLAMAGRNFRINLTIVDWR